MLLAPARVSNCTYRRRAAEGREGASLISEPPDPLQGSGLQWPGGEKRELDAVELAGLGQYRAGAQGSCSGSPDYAVCQSSSHILLTRCSETSLMGEVFLLRKVFVLW